MIPLAWVEACALNTDPSDTFGHLRHTWRVVYRCPQCDALSTQPGPPHQVGSCAPPAPVTGAHIAVLAHLIASHTCKEPPRA